MLNTTGGENEEVLITNIFGCGCVTCTWRLRRNEERKKERSVTGTRLKGKEGIWQQG
jgi:hypothetical protein